MIEYDDLIDETTPDESSNRDRLDTNGIATV